MGKVYIHSPLSRVPGIYNWRMKSQVLLIIFFSINNGISCSLNSLDSFKIDDIVIPKFDLNALNVTSKTSKAHCKPGPGLQCGARTVLDLGSEFLVSSRRCGGGTYPGHENCRWTLDVSDQCLPRGDCSYLDIIGNWRRG